MDPLSLVRDFNVNNKVNEIRVAGDQVHFGDQYVFPKASFTAFKTQKDYCTLETVLYVLQTRKQAQAEYLKAAQAVKLPTLGFVDRKNLLTFLDGKGDLQLGAGPAAAVLLESAAEPAAKKARLEDGLAIEEKRYERQLRDRNSMLLAPTKDFKRVLEIANRASAQLSTMLKQQQQQQAAQAKAAPKEGHKDSRPRPAAQAGAPPAAPAAAVAATKPSSRYARDNTADQLKAMGGDAAVASALGSVMYGYAGSAAQQQQQQQQQGTAAPVPTQQAPAPPTSASSHAPQPRPHSSSRDSSSHKHSSSAHAAKSHHHSSGSGAHHRSAAAPSSRGAGAAPAAAADPLRGAMPIILVPSGLTALVNMYNAGTLLEEGRFESSAAAAASGKPKAASVEITRTAGKPQGKGVRYQLTDKAPPKGSSDWDRVVAVIVQGAKWQFKDWPYKGADKGDLSETFQKVCGFFLYFADEKVPEVVAAWNVKRLGLARERRHMDATVALDFWTHLDNFLTAKRSVLAF